METEGKSAGATQISLIRFSAELGLEEAGSWPPGSRLPRAGSKEGGAGPPAKTWATLGGVSMGKSVCVTLLAARTGWDGGGCQCRGARKGRISL